MPHSPSEIVRLDHSSDVLKDNPLGDPHQRVLPVYLPPGYHDDPQRRYPVVWMLSGFTGWGERMLNLGAWDENIQQQLDRLVQSGKVPPLIMPLPDCFTRYGGSQYLNSEGTGRYEDYLVEELVPLVDQSLRTLPQAAHRGVVGKSSGGYGALVLGMRHPGVFGALACHSGDVLFEYCYGLDFPAFVNGLPKYGGLQAFLDTFASVLPYERDATWHALLNTVAMSACYSPNPGSPFGFDLPCDTHTAELIPEVWQRWLAWDPLRMLDAHTDALRGMRSLYVDCGSKDEFHLHLGARAFTRKLDGFGIAYHYEEFDAGHMNIGHRYDTSLPMLAAALNPP